MRIKAAIFSNRNYSALPNKTQKEDVAGLSRSSSFLLHLQPDLRHYYSVRPLPLLFTGLSARTRGRLNPKRKLSKRIVTVIRQAR